MTTALADEVSRAAAAFDLRGRRALVTGGTRGTGRAVVLALALAGADVATCHRHAGPDADALAGALTGIGGDHHLVRADVRRAEDVAALTDVCRSRFGTVDIVVNAVGARRPAPFAGLDLTGWRGSVDANLTPAFLVTHGALPLLSPPACVVSIGSRAAEYGMAGHVPDTAAQAALVGFTRSLAKELGPAGVRVNLVAANPDTVSPADVAAVVLFLASDEAGFITGETFPVDGGTP
jgi:3-oxoacyl-[acyl-carrier protein] reductase